MPVINWDLVWTIAAGVVIGFTLLGILSLLEGMWRNNWRVTILLLIMYTAPACAVFGAFYGWFGWFWLLPGCVTSFVCFSLATNILAKEEGDPWSY